MKKLTKLSLGQLARVLPVLTEQELSFYLGGGDGTYSSPFTFDEFRVFSLYPSWTGGYVSVPGQSFPIYFGPNDKATGDLSNGDYGMGVMYNSGYGLGYKAGSSTGSADDIALGLYFGINVIISGPEGFSAEGGDSNMTNY